MLRIERSKIDCLQGSPKGRRAGTFQPGAFGYHLHRKLMAMGVTNYVVQPRDWDERGKGVKNDRLDVLALCPRLDRFSRGNRKAFSLVRVPSEEEERERAFTRQRQQIVRERQRLQAMGRSLLASHGIHVTGKWWTGKTWKLIGDQASAWVIERLKVRTRLIAPMEAGEKAMTEAIQEVGAEAQIPRGVARMGQLALCNETTTANARIAGCVAGDRRCLPGKERHS